MAYAPNPICHLANYGPHWSVTITEWSAVKLDIHADSLSPNFFNELFSMSLFGP